MPEEVMIVSMVGIMCATGTFIYLVHTIRTFFNRKADPKLVDEMRLLREEIRQLRKENHDLMLTFDTAITQADRRLDRLEARPTAQASPEQQYVGLNR